MTNENDRELLELAAKAAGYKWDSFGLYGDGNWFTGTNYLESWNPLTDDGDALRLAVQLGIDISNAQIGIDWDCQSRYELTRRAIVRTAAEIGESIK